MRLPADRLIIKRSKLTGYLLVWQEESDKSRFLERCGYHPGNVDQLEAALRTLVAENEAVPDFVDEFGERFKVMGQLPALAGRDMLVTTIWMLRVAETDTWRFVTLYPGGR